MFCAFGLLLPDARDRYLKSRLSWVRPSLTRRATYTPIG